VKIEDTSLDLIGTGIIIPPYSLLEAVSSVGLSAREVGLAVR
jgi:hypothetical protein